MAYNIKAAIRAAKNMQYEPIEVKVREATNNDAWGVSTSAMSDIARSTHHHDEYALLFKMVWKRLTDTEHVMHVQKALILTDFLLRNGAERFINDAKRRARDISALQKYKQYDANNRDVGGDVRAKAKNVYELLTNDAKLAEERAKATSIRDVKLSGIGNDGYGPGDTDRDTHKDRFTDGDGGESPRHDDWEKENQEESDRDRTPSTPHHTTRTTPTHSTAHHCTACPTRITHPLLCYVMLRCTVLLLLLLLTCVAIGATTIPHASSAVATRTRRRRRARSGARRRGRRRRRTRGTRRRQQRRRWRRINHQQQRREKS